ncbi:hypothetical protein BC832DRAFT_61809 [Gaertneriomyces semiglobifer]|nr:hypothetical protein BC832DRAFT_61809 [Gaertneriomyces semiglobifer]
MLDVMRLKVNRYEFAIKEAIIFLGRPMLNFDDWLNKPTEEVIFRTSDPKVASNKGSPPQTPVSTSATKQSLSIPAQMAAKQQAQQDADLGMNRSVPPLTRGATALEVQCMECMRLSLNYLRNAQASVQAIDGRTTHLQPLPRLIVEDHGIPAAETPTSAERVGQESPSLMPLDTSQQGLRANSRSRHGSRDLITASNPASPVGRRKYVASQKAAAALLHAATSMPDDDYSDLATNPASRADVNATALHKCSNCRDVMLQLNQYQVKVENLTSDIRDLANQLEQERITREALQLSKDLLDQELEELTAQLFDQANNLVREEAKMRDDLEATNRQLRGELREVMGNFRRRDEELQHLRISLGALENAKLRSTSWSSPRGSLTSPQGSQLSLSAPYKGSAVHRMSLLGPPLAASLALSISVDGIIFAEFKDHVKTMVAAPPEQLGFVTAFLKRCMVEDIEPCLFFLFHTETNGTFVGAPMSTAVKKKLIDNVVKGWCEIVPNEIASTPAMTSTTKPLIVTAHSTASSTPNPPMAPAPTPSVKPKAACLTCSIQRECDYKIRFTPPVPLAMNASTPPLQQPPTLSSSPSQGAAAIHPADRSWSPLCRFCRERVLSVSDFFEYLSRIREMSKQGSSLLGMFRQVMWLRRRMANCRVGSVALFEGETGGGYAGPNLYEDGGDWEKFVHITT